MLTSYATPERSASPNFLEGQVAFSHPRLSNNREVILNSKRSMVLSLLKASGQWRPTQTPAQGTLSYLHCTPAMRKYFSFL
ncbi:hypothetical protein H8959_016102 [Pygathrix nigripes]